MHAKKKKIEISYRRDRKSLIDIKTFNKSKGDVKITKTLIIKTTKCFRDRRRKEKE